MTSLRRRRLPVIAVAGSLAIAMPLLLSGCSLIPHLPGSGSGSGGGGISIPGLGSAGTGKLPSSFPSDVPVVKGDIISGVSVGSGTDAVWNVTVKVASVDAFDGIQTQLTGAGFTAADDATAKTDKGATGAFSNDSWDVVVAVAKGDDKTGWVANYTVTKASK
jgi:hypothetical protein